MARAVQGQSGHFHPRVGEVLPDPLFLGSIEENVGARASIIAARASCN